MSRGSVPYTAIIRLRFTLFCQAKKLVGIIDGESRYIWPRARHHIWCVYRYICLRAMHTEFVSIVSLLSYYGSLLSNSRWLLFPRGDECWFEGLLGQHEEDLPTRNDQLLQCVPGWRSQEVRQQSTTWSGKTSPQRGCTQWPQPWRNLGRLSMRTASLRTIRHSFAIRMEWII